MTAYILLLFIVILNIGLSKNESDSKIKFDLKNAHSLFEEYVIEYDKHYSNKKEYNNRFKIFKQNLAKLNQWNKKSNSTVFGINSFTDLSYREFSSKKLGLKLRADKLKGLAEYKPEASAPESLDYRQNGYVTEVKNQGGCGSCYVFSAIGAIEGEHAKKHGELIALSDQQGLDCSSKSGGCHGGWMKDVMDALHGQGGAMRQEDYPYVAAKKSCHTNRNKIAVRVTGGDVFKATEEDLKSALADIGPLAIAIYVCDKFGAYKEGIFNEEKCKSGYHAVVLVGYGSDGNQDYWIIKNSWGSGWGEQGYMRVAMGRYICEIGHHVVAAKVD